jgi:hypothetical protein
LSLRTWWAPWFGLAIVTAGMMIRILRRRDPNARWIIVAGAVLVFVGMVVPYTETRSVLPAEYSLFFRGGDLLDKSIATASIDGFDSDAMVRFISLWHLLVLGLVGVAVGFSIAMSTGPWDSSGLVLRPVGWVIGFWIPATMALYTLNIMGWHGYASASLRGRRYDWEPFTTALFAGRGRLVVLTIPAVAWLAIGLAGLYANLVAPRLTTGGPGRSGSAR